MSTTKPISIDEYIASFPKDVQEIMQQIRTTIKDVVPGVEETISYGMAAFNLHEKYVIYFAGYKKHIGVYPVPNDKTFEKEFAGYKTSEKGAIQFPLDKPIPFELIAKIARFNAKRNKEKSVSKSKKA